ncbi:MAG: Coenzyme F420 hydrogenase/dehydrogenase, beta subunit C-terminal domain [Clostridia bacterium]|nr:Coenzyme F420 hydrogenase/dehydrogenase, beta subunit C-terminal domain [Clostridia bacterium]
MIDIVRTDQCVLCRACSNACPAGAIRFDKESGSFLYPTIDPDKCVGCEACARACPVLREPVTRPDKPQAVAARSTDDDNRRVSTSGGIFWEAARRVLADGGYVCGAVWNPDFTVSHVVTNDPDEVRRMRGSKYLQSSTEGVFREIRTLLKGGKTVLFTGCPCQSAGLRSFLGREYDNLFIIDLICHGIPSPRSLRAYLDLMEEQYGSKAVSVSLRSKDKGWHRSGVRVDFENHRHHWERITADTYMKGFLWNVYLKEACHDCPFRAYKSGSDLTLGDCWGAEAEPEIEKMDDNKGLSAVLIHTGKGRRLLDSLGLETTAIPLEVVERNNKNLLVSPEISPTRSKYFAMAEREGELAAMKRYLVEKPKARRKRRRRERLRDVRGFFTGKKTLY